MPDPFPLEVADSSKLTDAEWSEINKLRRAYEKGGDKERRRGTSSSKTIQFVTLILPGHFFQRGD
jgi:hypothetical protein